jgi:lysophospholipase L1-like esterase
VLRNLDEVRSLTVEHDVPVLLLVFPLYVTDAWSDYPYREIHGQIAAAARARALHVLDLYDTFAAAAPPQELRQGTHPNPRAHRLVAEAIRAWIAGQKGRPMNT